MVSIDGAATTVDVVVRDGVSDVKLVASFAGKTATVPFEKVKGSRLRARLEAPASTSVDYDVVSSVGSLAHGRLDTLPERGATKLTFCGVGDSGWPKRAGRGVVADEVVAVARLIEDQSPRLVIHVGDLIYFFGQESGLDPLVFAPFGPSMARVPFFSCVGNHDVVTKEGAPILDALPFPPNENGNRYYSFDAANVHFACIDSNAIVEGKGSFLDSAQGKWLRADLASTTATWKVVFFHHPLYAPTKVRKDERKAMRAALEDFLDQAGTDLVLTGHEHYYHRTKPCRDGEPAKDGMVHIITGGGGAPTWISDDPLGKDLTAGYGCRYHMTRFDVDGSSMHVRAIGFDPNGKPECFDDATITTRKSR